MMTLTQGKHMMTVGLAHGDQWLAFNQRIGHSQEDAERVRNAVESFDTGL
jgi:hypothetical protein